MIPTERQWRERWFLQIGTANIFLSKSTTNSLYGLQNFICSHGKTSPQQSTIPRILSLFKSALTDDCWISALSFRYLREITDFALQRNIVRCNRKSLATVQVGKQTASLIFRYPRRADRNWLENAPGSSETFFLKRENAHLREVLLRKRCVLNI